MNKKIRAVPVNTIYVFLIHCFAHAISSNIQTLFIAILNSSAGITHISVIKKRLSLRIVFSFNIK